MGRNIIGGIVGYVVLFIVMFATCSTAYLVVGTDNGFAPGNYNVTMTWILVSSVFAFLAAVVGGYVAAIIGRGAGAAKILAGIILVMGLLSIVIVAASTRSAEARTADTPNMEAMTKAQTPLWAAGLSTLIGIAGAIVGGNLRKDRSA